MKGHAGVHCIAPMLRVGLSVFVPFYRKKEQATTKKDRVTHCLTICENIVAQSLRWVFESNLGKCPQLHRLSLLITCTVYT